MMMMGGLPLLVYLKRALTAALTIYVQDLRRIGCFFLMKSGFF